MSAYIVEAETIESIVRIFLRSDIQEYEWDFLPRWRSKFGLRIVNEETLTKLGNQLWKMNVDAVNYRYEEKTPYPTFTFEGAEKYSIIQSIKSIDCFLYQCSEGEIDKRKLYKLLDKFGDELAAFYARHTKEYEAAAWGLLPTMKIPDVKESTKQTTIVPTSK